MTRWSAPVSCRRAALAINVDGEIAYIWLDADPESPDGVDDYNALQIGIGTAITF